MRCCIFPFVLVSIFLAFGCRRPPNLDQVEVDKRLTNPSDPDKVPNKDVERRPADFSLQFHEIPLYDAFEYTFGGLKFNLVNQASTPDAIFNISAKRLVTGKSIQKIDDREKNILAQVCRDIQIMTTERQVINQAEFKLSQTFHLIWRSHYQAQLKKEIGKVMVKYGLRPDCTLRLTISNFRGEPQNLDIVFRLVADQDDKLLGTLQTVSAKADSVMLLDQDRTGFVVVDPSDYLIIEQDPMVRVNIPALVNSAIQVTSSSSRDSICRLHASGQDFEVVNPNSIQRYEFSLATDEDFEIHKIALTSSGNRRLPSCQSVTSMVNSENLEFNMSCANLFELIQEGADEMCAFEVEIRNQKDPENTLIKPIRLHRLNFVEIDVSTIQKAYQNIPEHPKNPVRNQSTMFVGFDSRRMAVIQSGMDLWLNVLERGYDKFYANRIREIRYVGIDGCASDTAGAFAKYGDQRFYWCYMGGMQNDSISDFHAPGLAVYVAMLMYHETLHTHSIAHDIQDYEHFRVRYQPCEGTSQAAEIAVEMATCRKLYCQSFKDNSVQSFKNEMNYSLKNDGRRFQGRCQQWNERLGLRPFSY